jgi:hypothetical protein
MSCDIPKSYSDYAARRLISVIYRVYLNGFYINAKRSLKDTRQAVKYIGRYLARAVIAECRIEEYDGKNVVFWYEDHSNSIMQTGYYACNRFIDTIKFKQ